MALDIYLDPDYAELIIDVNKLKRVIAEKITERDWLSNYVLPEIRNTYNLKLGVIESELFFANLNLEKLKRKIELYKEAQKYNDKVDCNRIDKIISKEFKGEDFEYTLMQEEIKSAIENTRKEKIDESRIDKLNYLYKELILNLNPLINLKNTILENQLYDHLSEAYINADLNKLISIKLLCEEYNVNTEFEIDEWEELIKLKKIYQNLLDENREIILNIRSSEMFSNKLVLENENLLRRKKEDIKNRLFEISKEYEKNMKILSKLVKKK